MDLVDVCKIYCSSGLYIKTQVTSHHIYSIKMDFNNSGLSLIMEILLIGFPAAFIWKTEME